MAEQPFDLTITEAAAAIAGGELTPLQLTESCLERIDAVDGKIKAWVQLDREGALEQVRLLDRELSDGKSRGPLHGIPVGIKDIFYVAGLRNEAGSKSWKGFVPAYDATVVARLKEAGAVILGKTHTTEFAFFDPAPTGNPWNTAHTPGGSSSGSGAAVSAGMCLAALGSQTMGSVLRPAAYNGVVGFKPQHGRFSTYGVVPLSWTLDHAGILARSVEDTALIFTAIAGHDPADCRTLDQPVPVIPKPLADRKAPRIGLVREYFYENADEEMRRHTDETVERLRQAGAEISEISLPPGFAEIQPNGRIILSVEGYAYHKEMIDHHRDGYRPGIRELLDEGAAVSAVDYANALQKRLRHLADIRTLFHHVDALLTPGAPGAAPHGLSATGSPVIQAPWTIVEIPSISLPTGLNRDDLPLAIQLAGPAGEEADLLSITAWCERALAVRLRPTLG